MRANVLIRRTLQILFTLPITLAAFAESPYTYEGVLSKITTTMIVMDANKEFRFDSRSAQCRDFRGDKITCETLIAVGYANKARLTLESGMVRKVEILELQQ